MVLEVAILHIKPEDISKFEAVFPKVEPIFRSASSSMLSGGSATRSEIRWCR